jgi:hypothetical protein
MNSSKIMFWVLLIIFLVFVGPFLTIWSLNVLFPALAIQYTLETWAAVILLQLALRPNIANSK